MTDAVLPSITPDRAAGPSSVAVSEVIRPAAIVPESDARTILVELAVRDARSGDGLWDATPVLWRRFDRPWATMTEQGDAMLLGTMQVAYGTPTRYAITVYRASITHFGTEHGWTVEALCDEALGLANLTLGTCPRAELRPVPPVFRTG